MKHFSHVCQRLESVPFNRSKPAILASYLAQVPVEEATWALYLLLGGQLPRLFANAELQKWILAESKIPAWLFAECHEKTGDFSETVALLAELSCRPEGAPEGPAVSLREWIEGRLLPLALSGPAEREATLREWWHSCPIDISWALHALAVGGFPVHVPRRVAEDAVREAWGADAVQTLDARLAALPLGKGRPVTGSPQLSLFDSTPANRESR